MKAKREGNQLSKVARRIGFGLMYGAFRLMALVPLRVLYLLSDSLAWLVRDVVGYRTRVVRENVDSALPELSESERRRVARKFYNFLGDYFVETVKMSGMSAAEMRRRMQFSGLDEVNRLLDSGRSVVLYLGHYCNWEWISSLPLHFKPDVDSSQIYHALENKVADETFLRLRSRFGATSVEMKDTLRYLLRAHRDGQKIICGFIYDQAPVMDSIRHFVDFLHHDTPVLTGAEKIARRLDTAVFYCDIRRPCRGKYICEMIKIADSAAATDEFYTTTVFYELLSRSIRRQPELWLWSHRRWKRTRAQFEEFFGDAAAERLAHL